MTEWRSWWAENSWMRWSAGLAWIRPLKQKSLERYSNTYTLRHKYYEQHYHMWALLASRTLYAFSLVWDPLANLSCLFSVLPNTMGETTQYFSSNTWPPVYSWSLLWTVLSTCSTRLVLHGEHRPSHLAQYFSNSVAELCKWWVWYFVGEIGAWLPSNVYFCVIA